MTDDRNDRADAGADFGSPASGSAPRGGLKALAARTAERDAGDDLDDAYPGDEAAIDRRFALAPVDAIARTALGAAMPADVRARLAADEPIALVVSVPGPDWADDIRMALATITATAFYFVRDGSARRDHVPAKGNLDVGARLSAGSPVVGISQAPAAFLPSALLAAADATLDVRVPDGATLARILALTGLTPPPDIPASPCAGLSFSEILSAFRKGADGRDVLAALARMTARKAGPDADDGVPALPDLPGHSGPARAWGTTLVSEFAQWRAGTRAWRDVSASAVLAGPPGTGKTMFAGSLAKALGVQMIATGVGEWFARTDGNLGDVAVAFQAAWDRAMAARPCVFFLDEMDAIPDRSTLTARGKEWWTPIVTLILTATDGAQTARDGLVLIGATNHASRLDAALVRRGRFDRVIEVGLPTADDIAAILAHHLDGALAPADLLAVARLARGASAADAAAWARDVRSLAGAAGRAPTVADVASVVAPADARTPDTIRRCAVHEAGHAVGSLLMGRGVECVTLVAAGLSQARTTVGAGADVPTLADVDADLVVTFGGRAAEQALLGSVSVGAERDLAEATAIVAAAHASSGLGVSLVHRAASPDAIALLNVDPDLRAMVDAHLADVYSATLSLIEANRDAVARVADALADRRFLTGDEVRALAGDVATGGAP